MTCVSRWESLTPFDGLVIANRHYLQAMQIDATKDLKAVAAESLDPALRWDVSESLALWLTEEALTPSGGSAPRWGLYTTATDGGFPSLGGPQAPYIVRSAPLILVVDSATDLAPTVLSSAYASQQLFFTDTDILRDGIAATGVGAKVLSIDRVADLAITEAAMANLTAALSALSLLLVLGAVVISVRLSADIYVLNAIRRIVPVRLAGRRWADILSARFVGETILLGAARAHLDRPRADRARSPHVRWVTSQPRSLAPAATSPTGGSPVFVRVRRRYTMPSNGECESHD